MKTHEERQRARREYMKRYQAARRSAKTIRTVSVELTVEEYDLVCEAVDRQKGPRAGAYKRMLLTGARFLANAGAPRGRKMRPQSPAE